MGSSTRCFPFSFPSLFSLKVGQASSIFGKVIILEGGSGRYHLRAGGATRSRASRQIGQRGRVGWEGGSATRCVLSGNGPRVVSSSSSKARGDRSSLRPAHVKSCDKGGKYMDCDLAGGARKTWPRKRERRFCSCSQGLFLVNGKGHARSSPSERARRSVRKLPFEQIEPLVFQGPVGIDSRDSEYGGILLAFALDLPLRRPDSRRLSLSKPILVRRQALRDFGDR